MSWITVIWSMAAAVSLTLATINLLVWSRKPAAWAHALFSLTALGVTLMAATELWMMQAGSAREFGTALRLFHVPVLLIIVSLVGFVRLYLQAGRPWLAWTVCGLRTLSVVANFVFGVNLNYREITSLRHIRVLGESVSIPEGISNPWMLVGQASLLLLVAFAVDAALTAWRRGARRRAWVVGGSIIVFVLAGLGEAVLVLWRIIPVPLTTSFFFLGVVGAMAFELSTDTLRAGELAEDLRESETRYRGIFDGAIEGMYRTSVQGKGLAANPALAKILGYGSAEDVVFSIEDTAHQVWANPDERTLFARRLTEQGTVRGYECQFKRRDGTLIWVSVNSRAVRGPNGQIAYFEGFIEDISDRKQAKEAGRESEARLSLVADSANVGFWSWDFDTGRFWATKKTLELYGFSPDESITYDKFLGVIHPEDRDRVAIDVREAFQKGEDYRDEYRIVQPDGGVRWMSIRAKAHIRLSGEPLRMLGVSLDITLRRQNEAEMLGMRLELAHLARVMAISELSTSLAHEINQPLGAILNNAEAAKTLLSRAEDKQEPIGEIIEDIIQDAQRAGYIVRKIRGIVKKGEAKLERLPVNPLIGDVIRLLNNNLHLNRVAVRLDLKPDLPDVRGDRVRLQQVLMNLITNAVDAMKSKPQRTLTVRSSLQAPNMLTVSVSDSGTGIDNANKDSVFKPFFTTKQDGLGFGLSICRSIIQEHGGRIWGENNPTGGATFSFSLKAWDEEPGG
jgi:two-component system, LuxR family, sensor kinase FixL